MKLKEYANLGIKDKKHVIEKFIGHKVNQICDSPSGYIDRENSQYIQRFRHEDYAYSEIILWECGGSLKAKLKNFESGEYEML